MREEMGRGAIDGSEPRKVGLGLEQDPGQPVAVPRIGARLASPKG